MPNKEIEDYNLRYRKIGKFEKFCMFSSYIRSEKHDGGLSKTQTPIKIIIEHNNNNKQISKNVIAIANAHL